MSANMLQADVDIEDADEPEIFADLWYRLANPPRHRLSVSGILVRDSEGKEATFYPDNNHGNVLYRGTHY